MARTKSDVNKSEEIRVILRQTPDQKASEVVEILAAKGITATVQDVYNARSTLNSKKKKGKRGRKPQENGHVAAQPASVRAPSGNAVNVVLRVRSLAGEVGGIKNLKQLVDAMVN